MPSFFKKKNCMSENVLFVFIVIIGFLVYVFCVVWGIYIRCFFVFYVMLYVYVVSSLSSSCIFYNEKSKHLYSR